jgi:tRNA A58 N-methylase Trm61
MEGSTLAGSERFLDVESITGGLDVEEGMRIADFGSGSGYFTVLRLCVGYTRSGA